MLIVFRRQRTIVKTISSLIVIFITKVCVIYMQYGQIIPRIASGDVQPAFILDAEATALASDREEERQAVLDTAKTLGSKVVFLTTRSREEIEADRLLGGAARVYQEGDDRSAAVRKAMGLMYVTRAVFVGNDSSREGNPVSFRHRSEVFSMFPEPEDT